MWWPLLAASISLVRFSWSRISALNDGIQVTYRTIAGGRSATFGKDMFEIVCVEAIIKVHAAHAGSCRLIGFVFFWFFFGKMGRLRCAVHQIRVLRTRFTEGADSWYGWDRLDDYALLKRKIQVSVQPSHERTLLRLGASRVVEWLSMLGLVAMIGKDDRREDRDKGF